MPLYSYEPNHVPDILARGQDQFTRMDEEARKVNDSAKAADAFMKANPELIGQLGLSPEQWKAGGSRDKVAALTGLMQSQGYAKAKQEIASQQAHQQLFTEQLKALQQQQAEDLASGEVVKRFTEGPPGFTLDNASAATGAPPAPDVSGIGGLLRANGYMPPSPAPGSVPGSMPMQAPITAPNAGYDQAGPQAATPPGSLSDALKPYLPDFNAKLRYAFQAPGWGGRGVHGIIQALAELQKVQQEGDTTMRDAVTKALPGGYYSYGFPGTHQRGVYPDVTAAPRVFDTGAGQFVTGPHGQVLEPRLPNGAAQEQSDVSALHQAEVNVHNLDQDIRSWNYQASEYKKDAKNNLAPDPAALAELKQRRALQMSIINRAGQALAAPSAPAAPGARGTGVGRVTTLQPPVGTVQGGYRYNGKFPPNDPRGWDKVQ